VLQVLREHSWPGNVRELRNVVERAILLGDGRAIRVADLPPGLSRRGGAEEFHIPIGRSLQEVEQGYLVATLRRFGGNRARTAEALGVSPKTLYNKLRLYALGARE